MKWMLLFCFENNIHNFNPKIKSFMAQIVTTSTKKSNERFFLKLTTSAVAKRIFFEKQGLKLKRP
jgi:hypothetical protein